MSPSEDPSFKARVTASDMVRTMDAYVALKRQRLVEQGVHFWDADRIASQDVLGVVMESVSETRWERFRRRVLRRPRPVIYRDAGTADFPTILSGIMADRMVGELRKESPWR